MTPEGLLRELEPLAHDSRMRRMVEVGRLAASDASVAATIAALEQGEFYQRWLALQACFGSQDGAHVARALRDPSRAIRGLAARLAALCCGDEQLPAALAGAPFAQRRTLLRRLLKRNRRAPIDTFLERLAATGDADLPRLL